MKRSNPYSHSRLIAVLLLAIMTLIPSLVLASDPPVNSIPYRKARSIALKAHRGEIKYFEQRQWKGIWVYDFRILSADKVLHEVVVDDVSGKILLGAPKKHPAPKHKRSKLVHTTAGPTPTEAHK